MTREKQWFAVYTRPKWEKKVAALLTKKGIDIYCPLNKIWRQWSDRKKLVLEPLFTSYVFVHVKEREHLQVKQTDGVIDLVYWLGKPAVIKDAEITAIRNFLNEYPQVTLEKAPVKVNDSVRIIHGALQSRQGKVIKVMQNTVKIVLPSLGYAMVAQVNRSHIEKVRFSPDNQSFVGPSKTQLS